MPNPSELQRLEEERADLIERIKRGDASRNTKENWLRQLREIERILGYQGKPYNSAAFGGSDGETGR